MSSFCQQRKYATQFPKAELPDRSNLFYTHCPTTLRSHNWINEVCEDDHNIVASHIFYWSFFLFLGRKPKKWKKQLIKVTCEFCCACEYWSEVYTPDQCCHKCVFVHDGKRDVAWTETEQTVSCSPTLGKVTIRSFSESGERTRR